MTRIEGSPERMHRLLVNPGSPATWEIQLKPGANFIGRSTANDFSIADPSVSSAHCRIEVAGNSIILHDLGSTNGSFINQQQVLEATLSPGQNIRLGNVELRLEYDPETSANEPTAEPVHVLSPEPLHRLAPESVQLLSPEPVNRVAPVAHLAQPPTSPATENLPPSPTSSQTVVIDDDKPINCKNHYQNVARFKCHKCNRHLCDLCVNTRGTAGGGLKFCKICGTECAPMVQTFRQHQADFFTSFRGSFKYPFSGDGLALLLGGTLFFGFLDSANYICRHSVALGMRAMSMRAFIFTFILATGYLFSYLKNVIYSTAQGDRHPPDWPELTEWQADIVSPMFQFVMVTLMSFGPAIALQIWSEGDYPWLVGAVALLGCVYFPMAFLAVAMFDTLAALNPLFVVGSILRVPREYAVAAVVFTGIVGLRWLSGSALAALLRIPLAPTILADLICLGLLIVEARILGLLYLSQKGILRWFEKRPDPALQRRMT